MGTKNRRVKKMKPTRKKKCRRKRGGIGVMPVGLATNVQPQSHPNPPPNSNAPLPDDPGARPTSPSRRQFSQQTTASATAIQRPIAQRPPVP